MGEERVAQVAAGEGRMKLIDLVGERFGKLVVIERADNYRVCTMYPDEPSHVTTFTQWRCKCDCGGEKVVLGINLRAGRTTSCGCTKRGRKSKNG